MANNNGNDFEIRCEMCGGLLGKPSGELIIIAKFSLGSNGQVRTYYFTDGKMTVSCCGVLREYLIKNGTYQHSTILTDEWVQSVT